MAAADGRIAERRVGIGAPYNAAMPEGAGRRIRGLLLDLDGTIYQAGSPIPGVGKTLAALREAGLSFRFVTNTTRKPRSAVLAALRQMGIEAKEGEVLTATVAAAAWLRRQGAERALLLLPEAAREDFPGLEPTAAEPEYVVVGDLGDAWSYQLLNRAFRALKAGASLVAIQRNRFWESDDGLALDAGAFVAALEYAADTEAELVGKPSPAFFAAAVADLGMPASQVAMVGDDLEADAQGARGAGLIGVAVRTGKYRPDDERRSREVADAVLDSVADLPAWLELGKR